MSQSFLQDLMQVEQAVPHDLMGASPLPKCFLMGYLAQRLQLKSFVEIGVFKGRSLFAMGKMMQRIGGTALGIDPYFAGNFKETELSDNLREAVDSYADSTDFSALFADVLETRRALGLESAVRLLRMTDEDAYPAVCRQFGTIGMLHIDGNHDNRFVAYDASHYIPLVQGGGVVVFDDIHWEGVRSVYDRYAAVLPVLYENEFYAILYKPEDGTVLPDDAPLPQDTKYNDSPDACTPKQVAHYQQCLPYIHQNVEQVLARKASGKKPSIFVAIPTYNQENYIQQCVDSAMHQYGDFDMTVVAFDDASTDQTPRLLFELQQTFPALNIKTNRSNIGMARNFTQVLQIFEQSGCDYFTILEGDDYFISAQRVGKHVNFLENNPDCSSVFNDFLLLHNELGQYELSPVRLQGEKGDVFDLASQPLVGNFAANTFCKHAVAYLPKKEMESVKYSDWLTGIMALEVGDLGHIREPLSVYRKCDSGLWTKQSEKKQHAWLVDVLTKFNQFTNCFYEENNIEMLNTSRKRAQ